MQLRSRVLLLLAVACLGPAMSRAAAEAAPARRPNVVVFLADDQGWGDLSVSGNGNLRTPQIDSLARAGASFDRFFVCPVCSPTRAEFLTGRYHPRGGVYSTSAGGERLNLDERIIAETFHAAGYATAAFGKWHNGMQPPYHPRTRGFDEFYGFCSGHWGNYFSPLLDHNGRVTHGRGYLADDLTEHAMDFIAAHRDRPFFCYVPYNIPHSPLQVPERFYARFKDAPIAQRNRDPEKENPDFTRAVLAMCENIDWNVGRVLRQLDELDLARDTIVVYFSDNGPNSWRWNGGLKGRKGSTDEGGVRVPCFIRWPGHIPASRRVSQIAGAIDLLPTLAGLADIPVVGDKPLDGVSLKPLLLGEETNWPDRLIFSHWRGRVSVRQQRFRLDHRGQLFDLTADPGQRTNVAGEHAGLTARLTQAVKTWADELLPGLSDDDRPFPVGCRELPIAQLPSRDARITGGAKRSNRFPNCTFIENWRRLDDRITWDLEALTAGRYEVVLYYACPEADVGATIELSCGDARLKATLTEAHDPPLTGAEHDRFPRMESYVKDFKPWPLGTIELTKGRRPLGLRALKIPGRQAMEVRMLTLTLRP